jgi:predicted metalloprotease
MHQHRISVVRPTTRWFVRILCAFVAVALTACTPAPTPIRQNQASAPGGQPAGILLEPVSAKAHSKRAVKPYDDTLRATLANLAQFWSETMPHLYANQFSPIKGGIYAYSSDSTIPSCGGFPTPYVLLQKNAFYCPENDFIAWDDEGLFPDLQAQHGTFLLTIVLAHEYGHAIQGRSQPKVWGIDAEQQADCFAGAWAAHLGPNDGELTRLRDRELDRALTGFVDFRDQVGMTSQDLGAHGSAFDRIRALQEGYEGGPSVCAAYARSMPELISVPYRNFKERFRGGNLPFDMVIPAAEFSLATYWNRTFGPTSIKPSASAQPANCTQPETVESFSKQELSWCSTDNTIRYDPIRLQRQYDEIGDVGVSTLFAIEWAQALQAQTGGSIASKGAYLSALCIAGNYTGSLYDAENPESSQLSPGDMDEAVLTLLNAAAAGRPERYGTGFEQVAAFRRGVLGTIDTCSQLKP